ncbi:hypothetical protein ACJMK2_015706, partial [Sinanodonta woodiana]
MAIWENGADGRCVPLLVAMVPASANDIVFLTLTIPWATTVRHPCLKLALATLDCAPLMVYGDLGHRGQRVLRHVIQGSTHGQESASTQTESLVALTVTEAHQKQRNATATFVQ